MQRGHDDVRVAFIAGTSWSGSTLLEQALAQVDGCVSVGELYWLGSRDWPSMVCECGREFRSCQFWQTVLVEAFGSRSAPIRAELGARSEGLFRHSIVPTLARSRSPLHPAAAFAELGAMIEPLYRAVETMTGATTIVDASKCALWGLAVSRVDTIDLRVVHLVRDAEGFMASDGRSRELPYPPGAMREPRPASRSLLTWLLLNLEAEILTSRVTDKVLVRYEDLTRAPASTARRVAGFAGLEPDISQHFADDALIVRRTGHAMGGNPRRPRLGQTVIERPDAPMTPSHGVPGRSARHPLASRLSRRYRRSASTTAARYSSP
jgi:hypothetical protein